MWILRFVAFSRSLGWVHQHVGGPINQRDTVCKFPKCTTRGTGLLLFEEWPLCGHVSSVCHGKGFF